MRDPRVISLMGGRARLCRGETGHTGRCGQSLGIESVNGPLPAIRTTNQPSRLPAIIWQPQLIGLSGIGHKRTALSDFDKTSHSLTRLACRRSLVASASFFHSSAREARDGDPVRENLATRPAHYRRQIHETPRHRNAAVRIEQPRRMAPIDASFNHQIAYSLIRKRPRSFAFLIHPGGRPRPDHVAPVFGSRYLG